MWREREVDKKRAAWRSRLQLKSQWYETNSISQVVLVWWKRKQRSYSRVELFYKYQCTYNERGR